MELIYFNRILSKGGIFYQAQSYCECRKLSIVNSGHSDGGKFRFFTPGDKFELQVELVPIESGTQKLNLEVLSLLYDFPDAADNTFGTDL